MLHPAPVAGEKACGLIYENEHSLNTERAAITKAAEIWNTSVVKLPRKYSIDFALLRDGEVKAWVEFKSRTNPIGKYPTYTCLLYTSDAADE